MLSQFSMTLKVEIRDAVPENWRDRGPRSGVDAMPLPPATALTYVILRPSRPPGSRGRTRTDGLPAGATHSLDGEAASRYGENQVRDRM